MRRSASRSPAAERASRVDPNDLTDGALASLTTAPALLQERVRGDDLRIYVLDGEVIAAAHIKTSNVDYRGHEDDVVAITVRIPPWRR
jgi:hypothetical protein